MNLVRDYKWKNPLLRDGVLFSNTEKKILYFSTNFHHYIYNVYHLNVSWLNLSFVRSLVQNFCIPNF